MKVITEQGPAPIISGDMKTVDIGISDNHEDQLMILNVLSNTLYTDKIYAVLREYGCNAFDANVEADKGDTPIMVRLPTRLDPTVAIRDYGFGMTEEQILQTFCKLGRSTKRNSNAYTGMLGIGSKAGFAYGDQFNVTSWAKGIKTIYACARLNGKPTLSKMHTEMSSELDGVEITVPVRQPDISEFVVKAERVFRYFKVRPNIEGATVTFNRAESEFAGIGWRYIGDGKSVAIMGNVGYDLNASAMGDTQYAKLIQAGVELDFNIGDLEIAANREGLQYRDNTRKAIIAKLRQVAKEMGSSFTMQIDSATSEWEAKSLYHDLLDNREGAYHYGRVSLRDILSGNVTWKGIAIQSSRVNLRKPSTLPSNNGGISITSYEKSLSYRRLQKVVEPESTIASKLHTLCINDLSKIIPSRVNGFFHAHPDSRRLIIFTFDSVSRRTTYWKEYLEHAPSIDQSSITPYTTPAAAGSNGSSGSSVHRKKHTHKAFTLDEKPHNKYSDARSMWWNTTAIDYKDGAGVYVLLDEFWIGHVQHPEDFRRQIVALRKAGLLTEPVYGIKVGRKSKLGPKWIHLKDAIQTRLDGLTTKPFLQAQSDYDAVVAYKTYVEQEYVSKVPSGTPIHKLLVEVNRMFNPSTLEVHALLNTETCKEWLVPLQGLPSPTVSLASLEKAMLDRYPMLQILGKEAASTLGTSDMTRLIEYIRLVENNFAGRTGTTKER